MAAAGVGIGLSGLSSSYLLTFEAVSLSGLGVAGYHPEAAQIAPWAAGASHVAMSRFSVAGNLGFTLGPLVVAGLLTVLGIPGTLPLMVPALLCAAVTFNLLRRLHPEGAPGPHSTASSPERMDDWPGFIRLAVAAVARSIVSFGLATFVALYVEHRLGVGAAVGDVALVTFYAAGTARTFLGANLAGRWSRIRTVRLAYLAAIPCLAA